MNEAIAFDTHQFVKNLKDSGFTEKQAEALAKEQVQLLNSNLATKVDILAIKADLEKVKADLEAKIEAVKLGLQADIHASKGDLLKWMVMAMIAQGTLIVALVVAFVKLL